MKAPPGGASRVRAPPSVFMTSASMRVNFPGNFPGLFCNLFYICFYIEVLP
jgi:hypothetical protein